MILLLAGIMLQFGCSNAEQKNTAAPPVKSESSVAAFIYDKAALPEAKPWTSETFKDNPKNFQFAVIGDRTGGSDPGGIFNRAIDQINLLQPEFVINVGDLIEGYSDDKADLNAEWDESDAMLKKLEMPFFRTADNLRVSLPGC